MESFLISVSSNKVSVLSSKQLSKDVSVETNLSLFQRFQEALDLSPNRNAENFKSSNLTS